MRGTARTDLDRIEKLKAGQGMLGAFAFGRGDLSRGVAGLGLEYGHRISDRWSAVARGELGYRYGEASAIEYNGLAAVRAIW